MKTSDVPVCRLPLVLRPDPTRVLVRPFLPGANEHRVLGPRALRILARIFALPEKEIKALAQNVITDFDDRHIHIRAILEERFEAVKYILPTDDPVSEARRILIGSYFTQEYSIESAALFNPSIVPSPDQSGLAPHELRFIMSLRATGEGHISSITFRSGIISPEGDVRLDPASRMVTEPRVITGHLFETKLFERKLGELGLASEFSRSVLGYLGETFTGGELRSAISNQRRNNPHESAESASERMLFLAGSNYETAFDPRRPVSERIIFPFSPSQSNGIEDARFVRFDEGEGRFTYYATYTAYDGRVILPQLLETSDFLHFRICTLNGPAVSNKGMAFFPRKIQGLYCTLSRQDNENIHIMFSDHPHFWYESEIIMRPTEPWEFVQLGNCGSPIETEAGWLVLSHGVGPMRKYCIGAFLLDLDDPRKVIGRLKHPLIVPEAGEREGYVPNVVYTCGAIVHGPHLVIPFALSDSATTFARVQLKDLLDAM